jgi:hypothetical protein
MEGYCSQEMENDGPQKSPDRNGNEPGDDDATDHTQVQGADTAGNADTHHRTNRDVRGGHRQAQAGSGHRHERSGNGGAIGSGWRQLGNLVAQGGHHLVTVGRQTGNHAEAADQQQEGRDWRDGRHLPGHEDLNHRSHRANPNGHFVRTMRVGHRRAGEHHLRNEQPLDAGVLESPVDTLVELMRFIISRAARARTTPITIARS